MTEDLYKILKDGLGEKLRTSVDLKNFSSIRVGGPAEFFYTADTIDDLVKAVALAYKNKIPYFVLGGGYNIIPSDSGFTGLVIKNNTANIAFSGSDSEVITDSGVSLGKLINLAASRDLGGLEFLFGVPGTIGGAVYGNAGAFKYEISDFVKSLIVLIPFEDEMKILRKNKEWMNFSYRSSKLKKDFKGVDFKPVILTVKLQLVRRRNDEILMMMQNNIKQKKELQPLEEISAGSFFTNPGTNKEMTAGYLLDKAGAKKLRVGGAAFSKKHANFLINKKHAQAKDIRDLANKARERVEEEFNLTLREEVEYIGRW